MDRLMLQDLLTVDLRQENVSAAWRPLAIGTVILILAGLFILRPALTGVPLVSAGLAGLLYLSAHILRAIRLAMLSVEMIGVTARTAVALHFVSAPVSLFMPFKLGELIRLWGLWRVSGKNAFAIVVLLIDRMYDSLFLLPLLAAMFALALPIPLSLVVLTVLAGALPLAVIVLGPKTLESVQRYVLANHNYARVDDVLRQIDSARRIVSDAASVTKKQALELSVISLLIWLSEFLFCLLLARGFLSALELLGGRLVTSWWSTSGADPILGTALSIMTLMLLAPWPMMCVILLSRWKTDLQRIRLRASQQDGQR